MKGQITDRQQTPILDSYMVMLVDAPEAPEVRWFICPQLKKIYINTAARPDAKIDRIVPFMQRET